MLPHFTSVSYGSRLLNDASELEISEVVSDSEGNENSGTQKLKPIFPLVASDLVRVTRSRIEQSAFEVRETASSEDGEEALARRDVDKLETVFLYYLFLYFLPSFNPNPLFTFITTL